MHMSDALLSPAVAGVMWGASAAAIAVSSKKLSAEKDDAKVPLMGALGAFVFAAQMINFTIPGTGSSGHLAGAMLLSILLGPCAGFIVIVSILCVQALFFADGGLLALGSNIFNIGIIACFFAYPLVYRPLAGYSARRFRATFAIITSSIAAMCAGALCVVLQTTLSGISSLPLGPFAAVMLPIHLVIGLVEGVVTAVVIALVTKLQPDSFLSESKPERKKRRILIIGFLALAIVAGGLLSRIASGHPDGLEWSVAAVGAELSPEPNRSAALKASSWLQEKISFLPDYGLRDENAGNSATSLAGIIGGSITLILVSLSAFVIKRRARRSAAKKESREKR